MDFKEIGLKMIEALKTGISLTGTELYETIKEIAHVETFQRGLNLIICMVALILTVIIACYAFSSLSDDVSVTTWIVRGGVIIGFAEFSYWFYYNLQRFIYAYKAPRLYTLNYIKRFFIEK